ISPRVWRPELEALGSRLMVLAGDAGPSGQGAAKLVAKLTQVQSLVLHDYGSLPWSDLVADRGTELSAGWVRFLDGVPLPGLALRDGDGEVAGISYRIRGSVALALSVMGGRRCRPHDGRVVMRVTRPGGRIGAIVRSQDMSWWSNLPL